MGCLTVQDVGRCGCAGFNCKFLPCGCKNPPNNQTLFSGITVDVYDHSGGTLLVSGTTDSTGTVTLTIPGTSPQTCYVSSSAPNARWLNYGANRSLSTGANIAFQFPTNSTGGYTCCGGIAPNNIDIPIHTPLTYTDADGSHTITWTSSCNAQLNFCPAISVSPIGPTCVGSGNTEVTAQITQTGPNRLSVGPTWWVEYTNYNCYNPCGTHQQGLVATVNHTITSIAVPLAFTVTAVPSSGNVSPAAPFPYSFSITVSE